MCLFIVYLKNILLYLHLEILVCVGTYLIYIYLSIYYYYYYLSHYYNFLLIYLFELQTDCYLL